MPYPLFKSVPGSGFPFRKKEKASLPSVPKPWSPGLSRARPANTRHLLTRDWFSIFNGFCPGPMMYPANHLDLPGQV